jgi:capsular polysaccharide transport system ATP-binding protein
VIRLERVDLTVRLGARTVQLLDRVTFTFSAPRAALLSREAKTRAGVIQLLSGAILPQRGRVARSGIVSWPIGQSGMFRGSLDGWSLISFLCDLYQCPHRRSRALVKDLLDEPEVMKHPFVRWPRESQMQFAYAAALIPRFDIYLIDGPLRLASPRFGPAWEAAFRERVARRQLIVSTTQTACLEALSPLAVEVDEGRLTEIQDLSDYLRRHRQGAGDVQVPEPASPQADDVDGIVL